MWHGGDQAKQALSYSARSLYSITDHISQFSDKAVPLSTPIQFCLGFFPFFLAAHNTNK